MPNRLKLAVTGWEEPVPTGSTVRVMGNVSVVVVVAAAAGCFQALDKKTT